MIRPGQSAIGKWLAALFIGTAAYIVYSNTFHVPFVFDDISCISANESIRRIGDLAAIFRYWPSRFVAYLTFALNYHFHQTILFGYHAVNLGIHIATALLVWYFVRLTFSTPVMKEREPGGRGEIVAFFCGLIFAVHPIQTQAVTYVYQRIASLATFFYMAALVLYLKARIASRTATGRHIARAGALAAAILGMFTKEIVITLPLTIMAYEWFFFPKEHPSWRKWKKALPLLILLAIIPVTALLTHQINRETLSGTSALPGSPDRNITQQQYLLTQAHALLTYSHLLVIPVNQNLDYDYPLSRSLSEVPVAAGTLLCAILIALSFLLYRKRPFISFGILWFLFTLFPQSSFLPKPDLLVEHRLYLPMVGYCMVLTGAFLELGRRKKCSLAPLFFLALFAMCYSWGTYARNRVWRDEVSLWQDVVSKSPQKIRPHHNLASGYANHNQYDKAIPELNFIMKKDPAYTQAYTMRAYAFFQLGKMEEAFQDLETALRIGITKSEAAKVFVLRGKIYNRIGQYDHALVEIQQALSIDPSNAEAYNERGVLSARKGDYRTAFQDLDYAIRLNPGFVEAYNNRGLCAIHAGKYDQASTDFAKAVRLKPDFADVHVNIGLLRFKQNRCPEALESYRKALELNPKLAQAHSGMAVVFFSQKNMSEAAAEIKKAMELAPGSTELTALSGMITGRNKPIAIGFFQKGNQLREQGSLAEALNEYTQALKANPDWATAYYNRGQTYQNLGRYEEAAADYTEAIQHNWKDVRVFNNRGVVYDRLGRLDEAISDYSQALKLAPSHVATYNNRGNAFFKKHDFTQAIKDYSTALSLDSRISESYRNRGMAYAKMKENGKAASDFQVYLRMCPDDPLAPSLKKFIAVYRQSE